MADTSFKVSIIINNYNYGNFLGEAIESACSQTKEAYEIIVVDDGSTDDSLKVLAGFSDAVISIVKENGGQASAINAGYMQCSGDVILILDSDDLLLPTALETATPFFLNPDVVKVQWPSHYIDVNGTLIKRHENRRLLPRGDFRALVREKGPSTIDWCATSCNAWSTKYLSQVLPAPESVFRHGIDFYLSELSHFYGLIESVPNAQTLYRCHGRNNTNTLKGRAKLDRELKFYDKVVSVAHKYLSEQGISIDPKAWQQHSWWYRIEFSVRELKEILPLGAIAAIVDGGTWPNEIIEDRNIVRFGITDEGYETVPTDDATAIKELKNLKEMGVTFIVYTWSCYWWFKHYEVFASYIQLHYKCILENERIIVFDLAENVDVESA